MNPRLPFLREKTAKLTTSPGVYLMKNEQQTIIYVGKAKNLKNRTKYFTFSLLISLFHLPVYDIYNSRTTI